VPEVVPEWGPRHPVLLLLLALVASGDFANFYVTLSVLADEQPIITLLVVVALTSAALALAHAVGVQLREHATARRAATITMATSWLLLGLCAAAVRWAAPPLTASLAETSFGGAAAPVPAHTAQQLTSLLLLGLYLAGGVLAAWIGYVDHDPLAAARRTTWRPVWTGFRHRRHQTRLGRAETVLRQHRDEQQRLATNHAAAVADREALAAELKAYTRLLIATSIGDPVSTEALLGLPADNGTGDSR
jgi:hypothetical protein